MEKKSKLVYIVLGLNIFKEIWEAFSDEPIITGIFKKLNLDSTSEITIFLSKYWLLIISIIILLWLLIPQLWRKIKGLDVVIGKHFINQIVAIDGKHFMNCVFENCRIKWSGDFYKFEDCRFTGNRFYEFHNSVSIGTIRLLDNANLIKKDDAHSIFLASTDSLEKGFSNETPSLPKSRTIQHPKNKKTKKGKVEIIVTYDF